MLHRKTALAQAAAACLVLSAPWAIAQSASNTAPSKADEPSTLETVTVTGIRANLRKAIEQKRLASEVIESVSADDIGKLPDTTIADSLARLPGLQANVDRGNASQISARGLGPRLTFGTLNGRELASSEPDRSVRFEQFPAELIGGAQIYKSQAARLIEGGVAASIDLTTVSPLDYKTRKVTLSAATLYYPLANEVKLTSPWGPRVSASYVDQFLDNTLGVALGVSHQDQPSVLKGFIHWGFNESPWWKSDLNGDGVSDKSPWGFQSLVNFGREKRDSAMAKVQWRPAKGIDLTLDAYKAKNTIKEPGVEQWVDNAASWSENNADYTSSKVVNNYVVSGITNNTGLTTVNVQWNQVNSTEALGLNGKIDVGDWKLEADVSHSKASRTSVWNNIRQHYNGPLTLTFNTEGKSPSFTFDANTSDPSKYTTPGLGAGNYGWLDDSLGAVKVDLSRPLNEGIFSSLRFGARGSQREKSYHEVSWSQAAKGVIPASAYERFSLNGLPNVAALREFDGVVNSVYGGWNGPNGQQPSQENLLAGWRVKEKTASAYVQADLDLDEVAGHPLTGNVGLRVVRSSQNSSGLQSINDATPTSVSDGISYTNVLPSLNLSWHLSDKEIVRFGLSRAMARPPLDELRGSRNLSQDRAGSPLSGSSGNPRLKPFVADQLDVAYESYFSRDALFSVGGFYKAVKTYIGIEQDKVAIDGTEANLVRSVNGSGGNIRGLEVTFQRPLDFVSPALSDFGVYTTYAFVESNIRERAPAANPLSLNGLARHNLKADLWYATNGFEARLGYNYQSAYTGQVTWSAGSLNTNEAAGYWGLSLSKALGKNFEVKFQADNLTNVHSRISANNNPLEPYRNWEFGRRYSLGISYKL